MSTFKNIQKRLFAFLFVSLSVFCCHADEVRDAINLGDSAQVHGQPADAVIQYARLFDLFEANPNASADFAEGFYKGGNCAYNMESPIDALNFWVKGVDAATREHNDNLRIRCLGNIALVYNSFDNHERALVYYEKVYRTARAMGDLDIQAGLLHNMIISACKLKRTAQAMKYYRLLERIPAEHSVKPVQFREYMLQGFIARSDQDYRTAIHYFRQALDYAQLHDELGATLRNDPLMELGSTYSQMGELDTALDCYKDYLHINDSIGASNFGIEVYRQLYETYYKKGEPDSAQFYKTRYLALSDSAFNSTRFAEAQNKLLEYEDRMNNEQIGELNNDISQRNSIIIAIAVISLLLIIAVLIFIHQNRTLSEAYRHLVTKNEEYNQQQRLISDLRSQVEQLSSQLYEPEAEAAAEPETDAEPDDSADISTNKFNLTQEQIQKLANQIDRVLNDVSVICDPQFSLSALAKLVHSNTSYLSYVINATYGKNFKTMLGERRIAEASRRLADAKNYSHLTIQAIAEQVGYNAISSFTATFKKIVGMTPSVYQKLAQEPHLPSSEEK